MKRHLFILIGIFCVSWFAVNPAFAQVTPTNTQTSTSLSPVAQSGSLAYGAANVAVVTESTQQNIGNTPFFPLPVPLIQGGRVGDVTEQLPNFAGMQKLRLPYIHENGQRREVDPGETVNPAKIEHFYGKMFCRISIENVWEEIVSDFERCKAKGWNPEKMRYRVYYKDKAKAIGVNLGGSGGASGFNGSTAVQGSGGGIFGYSSSTADPVYIVMICEVVQ
jgi:hypothetical protein